MALQKKGRLEAKKRETTYLDLFCNNRIKISLNKLKVSIVVFTIFFKPYFLSERVLYMNNNLIINKVTCNWRPKKVFCLNNFFNLSKCYH